MRLQKLSFQENETWEFNELILNQENLIVGKNATGKTRIINIIFQLSQLICFPQIINDKWNGKWTSTFVDADGHTIEYILICKKGKIIEEQLSINNDKKLERTPSSTKIYSEKSKIFQEISPPNDKLVLHIRRDKNEFPFLEILIFWAEGVQGFGFANTSPQLIVIPNSLSQLVSLNTVPSVLDKLSQKQVKNVLTQLEEMGYFLETVTTGFVENAPPIFKIIYVKEKGISKILPQDQISQGMFRAFSLLIICEFLRNQNKTTTILIDDFGEGLDFERNKKLANLIFYKESLNSKIQFIITSNDYFLMNCIPLENLTICHRKDHIVECLNYSNSKSKFDEWKQLSLSNFDLFSSDFLFTK